jgi:hypothetical protein
MSERQYNKEQVAAIFELASQVERTALPKAGEGLTLTALQEIGREVGISPESISLAAQSLEQAGTPAETTKFVGLPIGVGRTTEFNRPLTDSDWEGLVADLRTTFRARGNLRIDGPFRQWTNGNLRALVEPTPAGHRLRLETMNGNARTLMTGGLLIAVGAIATAIALSVTNSSANPGAPGRMTFAALMGLGIFAFGALRVVGWARTRRAQIEEVTARLVGSAGKSAPAALPASRMPDLT